MQIEWAQIFGISGVLGFGLGVFWFAAYICSGVWAWVWAWVDDSEAPKDNPLILLGMTKMGWKSGGVIYRYKKGDQRSDGERAFFFPFLVLVFAPWLMTFLVFIYPVTLCAICLYLIARLTRFARRHKKLFDKHVTDPVAHK